MDNFIGYTVPLSDSQVFALIEFGEIHWVSPVDRLCKFEFIMHTYCTGEVQYEALIKDTIFMYNEDQLKSSKAIPSGHFGDNSNFIAYHMSEYDIHELMANGKAKLWDADTDEDYVFIEDFRRYTLGGEASTSGISFRNGGNAKYVTWIQDVLVYFYESDKPEVNSPYYRSL
jgi:hypothetical protein